MEKKEHWNKVYENKKFGAYSWFQEDPQPSLDWIRTLGLAKNAAIIDVGGGSAMLLNQLILHDYKHLFLLDVSSYILKVKETQLGNKVVTYCNADILNFNSPQPFDLIHDRAVFHFILDDKEIKKYVAKVKELLITGGYFILGTFAKDGPEQCSNLPVKQYDVEDLQNLFKNDFKMLKSTSLEHITPFESKQKFTFVLLERL